MPGGQFGGQLEHRGTLRVGAQLLGCASRISKTPAITSRQLRRAISFKGRLVQYARRTLRPYPGKATAEIHDYHDTATGVLAASLAKRAAGYISLGFPDPRHIPHTQFARSPEITAYSLDNQCAISRNPGLAAPGTQPLPNHARQQRAECYQVLPAFTAS